jgi:hypothetical protein
MGSPARRYSQALEEGGNAVTLQFRKFPLSSEKNLYVATQSTESNSPTRSNAIEDL